MVGYGGDVGFVVAVGRIQVGDGEDESFLQVDTFFCMHNAIKADSANYPTPLRLG